MSFYDNHSFLLSFSSTHALSYTTTLKQCRNINMLIKTPISVGELLDKVTILQIKQAHIDDCEKLKHVQTELNQLSKIVEANSLMTPAVKTLMIDLKKINQALWNIEDEIRACEKNKDFSQTFIELARSVYMTNDKRADIKRQINILSGSELCEVKSYENYTEESSL